MRNSDASRHGFRLESPDGSGVDAVTHDSAKSGLRVLVLAPTPFFGDRGCHVRIYEEIRSLAGRGVRCAIVTYPTGRDLPGLEILRARSVAGIEAGPLGFSPGRPVLDASLFVTAELAVRRFRPHLIHAHLHEGIAIGVLLRWWHRIPLIADLQGSLVAEMVDQGVLSAAGLLAGGLGRVERWLVRQPDHILTSSGHGLALLEEQGAPRARLSAFPDGVDLDTFQPQPSDQLLRDRLSLGDKRVVVFLGVLTDYQGVDLLVEIAARLARERADVHLLVMGYPNEERYRAAAVARGLGEVMTFPGRIPYADASRWLGLGTVAVSPKRSLTEANGKLLNYMACGLPVVASDTPVNRELLGAHGVYASVGDAEAFALRIGELLDHPTHARARGGALRRRAEPLFAWPALAERLEGVYRAALE